jgi:hypothetical protein
MSSLPYTDLTFLAQARSILFTPILNSSKKLFLVLIPFHVSTVAHAIVFPGYLRRQVDEIRWNHD